MSITATGVDARGYLIGWANGLKGMYVADLKAMPEEMLTATHGGVTRPANALTADTVVMLNAATELLKGNGMHMEEDGYANLAAELTSGEAQIAAISTAVDNFCAALAAASDEHLNSMAMAPWGMETPVFMLAQIAVSHIWYHDGQLNFIQALNGDEKVHWMGG